MLSDEELAGDKQYFDEANAAGVLMTTCSISRLVQWTTAAVEARADNAALRDRLAHVEDDRNVLENEALGLQQREQQARAFAQYVVDAWAIYEDGLTPASYEALVDQARAWLAASEHA